MDNVTPFLRALAARLDVAITLLGTGNQQEALDYLRHIRAKLPVPHGGNVAAAESDYRKFVRPKK